MSLAVSKAHAYGNDFLFAPLDRVLGNLSDLAQRLCNRHIGVGADGLILYTLRPGGAKMRLLNADGSPSELSGNGLRCLGALIARAEHLAPGRVVTVETDAGVKTLELLARDGERYTFRGALGSPVDVREVQIPVLDEIITASVLSVGNPQCVVLGPLPPVERFNRVGPALATHAMFPAGTNVSFAEIEAPDRVRVLIWERGVGPTTASGTGASGAEVAAAAHGGAARAVDIVAPGGSQRVEWGDDVIYLTGWAEVLFEGEWVRDASW